MPQDWWEPDCDKHWHLKEAIADSLMVSTQPTDSSFYLAIDLFFVRCIDNEIYLSDLKFSIDQSVLQK